MKEKSFVSLTTCMIDTIDVLDHVAGRQNLERSLHTIVRKLTEYTGCQTCAIIRLNPDTENLEILNASGLSWQFTKKYRTQKVSETVRNLIWIGESFYLPNTDLNQTMAEKLKLEYKFGSCYCVALSADQRPLGYLYLDAKQPDHFSGEMQMICQLYAKIISLAVLKENLIAEIHTQGLKDPQTGAVLYQLFYSRLEEAIAKAKRQKESLTVILIDVVKFDTILTSYGDAIAQQLMTDLMILVNEQIRDYDSMSKFGTDEIIISLPGHTMEDGLACTKKLYAEITGKSITTKKLNVNISVGLANYPDNATSVSGLLTAVKNALIESKRISGEKIYTSQAFFE